MADAQALSIVSNYHVQRSVPVQLEQYARNERGCRWAELAT
jgi:hypothetical protein